MTKPTTITIEEHAHTVAELKCTQKDLYYALSEVKFLRVKNLIEELNLYEAERVEFVYEKNMIRYYFQTGKGYGIDLTNNPDFMHPISLRLKYHHGFEKALGADDVLVREPSPFRKALNYIHYIGAALFFILLGIHLFTDNGIMIYDYATPVALIAFGYERQRLLRMERKKYQLREYGIHSLFCGLLIWVVFILLLGGIEAELSEHREAKDPRKTKYIAKPANESQQTGKQELKNE